MIRKFVLSTLFRSVPFLALAAAIAVLASLAGCNGEDGVGSGSGTGHLAVELTDKPIDLDTVQSVNVTIDSLIVYGDGDQYELMPRTDTFDLLTLTGGVTTLLAEDDLPVGFYRRIRLGVSEADMMFDDGMSVDLEIDSRKVDILVPFEIAQSAEMVITLDFEADASIHTVGTGSGKYVLRPVVTAIKVSDPDPIPWPGDPNTDPNGSPNPDPNSDPNS